MVLVQANARVPEEARPVLLAVAARLRDEPDFLARLNALLEDDAAATRWADRFEALEQRIQALEAERGPGGANNPHGLGGHSGKTAKEIVTVNNVHDRPTGTSAAADGTDWSARAAAIEVSSGEGRGRRLTEAGSALFDEMAGAGLSAQDIAKTLGMTRPSAASRLKKIGGG
ncbi:hypothetical protein [Acuticoccus mangrovi]|uniref:Uncharacterized protein n=1 Tax=Acuticoccus mangrovi TaxID=2796142 RepID=A0A934ISG4_9HYPH|nr:hypothetical protein [Acuticoccus mangrovi]MBJ3777875.1 hypothetical protein [Acuticoccus mangrovi]